MPLLKITIFCVIVFFIGTFCRSALGIENTLPTPVITGSNAKSTYKGSQHFFIHSQNIAAALVRFSQITNVDYIAPGHLLRNQQSSLVKGKMTPSEALQQLLEGTQLTFFQTSNSTFLISAMKKPKTINLPSTDYIEETIVTALKREQLMQDIPLAVSTISGLHLSQSGKNDTRDLFQVSPSVSYHGAISAEGQGLRIRGIGTGVIAGGIEQSVGTIIDGVATGPSGSGLQTLWDVERIEVLRGPQGTLFGKNVSAGAINQITNDPTHTLEWMLKGNFEAGYNNQRIEGFISAPISNHLLFRIAAFNVQQDKGSVYNVVRQQFENTKDRWGIRGKLLYEYTNWWIKFSSAFDTTNERCCARVFSKIVINESSYQTQNWVTSALEAESITASKNNRLSINDAQLYEKSNTWHSVLELGKNFKSGHMIKSISGHRQWHHKSQNDADNIQIDALNSVQATNKLTIFSQEFQLLSPANKQWDYLLGAYYYWQHFPRKENIAGGKDFADGIGKITIESITDIENIALFGHTNYYITPDFVAFSGLRLLNETIQVEGQQQGDLWINPINYPANEVKAKDKNYVGIIGLQYFFDDNRQLYLSIRRGYKGKAVDNPYDGLFFRAPQQLENGTELTVKDAVLKPETVILYEVGSKNYFLNRRLLLNATTYYSKFDNFQTATFDGIASSFRLTNAGVIKLQGIEVELQLRPWPDTSISASLAWNDTIFKSFNAGPCQIKQTINGTCIDGKQDLSGKNVNENPKWQYFLQYRQEFTIALGDVYFDTRYSWRDSVIYDGDLDPNTKQSAFGLLDIRIGLHYHNYEIALFVNNAFNENYSNRIIEAPMWQGAYQRYPGEARRFGIEFSFRHK